MTQKNRISKLAENALRKDSVSQKIRFLLTGIFNTALDFVVLNLLVLTIGIKPIQANFFSVSIAVFFSFFLNKFFVFKTNSKDLARQGGFFFLGTMFGMFFIQTSVIYSLTEVCTWPLDFAAQIASFLKFNSELVEPVIFANGSKIAATACTMVWNYTFYKFFVFGDCGERA